MAKLTHVQQVTRKDPKKVETGKRLAEWNYRKEEENAQMTKTQSESKLTYYGTGAVVAIGALDVHGYYVYQCKTPMKTPVHQPKETPDKFSMD